MEEELRELIAQWRSSAKGFASNQRMMETGPAHLRADAKLQEGWKEALNSCADKLEALLKG